MRQTSFDPFLSGFLLHKIVHHLLRYSVNFKGKRGKRVSVPLAYQLQTRIAQKTGQQVATTGNVKRVLFFARELL